MLKNFRIQFTFFHFFSADLLSKFFSLSYAFDIIFYFFVHHPLILKKTSTILEMRLFNAIKLLRLKEDLDKTMIFISHLYHV